MKFGGFNLSTTPNSWAIWFYFLNFFIFEKQNSASTQTCIALHNRDSSPQDLNEMTFLRDCRTAGLAVSTKHYPKVMTKRNSFTCMSDSRWMHNGFSRFLGCGATKFEYLKCFQTTCSLIILRDCLFLLTFFILKKSYL